MNSISVGIGLGVGLHKEERFFTVPNHPDQWGGSPPDQKQSANVHRAKSMLSFQWPKQDQWDPSPPEPFTWKKNISYINNSAVKIIIK